MAVRGVGAVRVFVLLGVLLASGCAAKVVYTPLIPPPRPMSRRPGGAVEVLVVTPPARPHTDVGLLQAFPKAGTWDAPIPEMITNLRERAGAIGCDAVLITSIDRRSSRYHSQSIQASCIVYDDGAPAVDAAPMPRPGAPISPPYR